MEITEIIKESFVFPSKDLGKVVIYIILAIIAALVGAAGLVLFMVGLSGEPVFTLLGLIVFILGLVVAFIVSGYYISIVKSGIEHAEKPPAFSWKENLVTGIKYVVVSIVYFIVPAIVVLVVGLLTGLYNKSAFVFNEMYNAYLTAPANTTVVVEKVVPQATLVDLGNAMIITGVIAAILFIIFAFLQFIAESRLANTDSLGEALNIPEAFRDIGRIGWGKVIAVILLVFIIIAVINGIISLIANYVSVIGLVSIIVTPYLVFFSARALGLLYSDIA